MDGGQWVVQAVEGQEVRCEWRRVGEAAEVDSDGDEILDLTGSGDAASSMSDDEILVGAAPPPPGPNEQQLE